MNFLKKLSLIKHKHQHEEAGKVNPNLVSTSRYLQFSRLEQHAVYGHCARAPPRNLQLQDLRRHSISGPWSKSIPGTVPFYSFAEFKPYYCYY